MIAYDARGHGDSDPADRYDYASLAADLSSTLDGQEIERAVLAGASMGAHTARLALEHPERVAGLVAITPAYLPDGDARPRALGRAQRRAARWRRRGLRRGLRRAGRSRGWRDTMITVLRQRMARHEHPRAVADALEQVPRSNPFDAEDELASIAAPAIVVADRDEADPGHPLPSASAGRSCSTPSCWSRSRASRRSPGKAASSRA